MTTEKSEQFIHSYDNEVADTEQQLFTLGKVNWSGISDGRKNNAVEVTVKIAKFKSGHKALSITGDIWNLRHTDIMAGGQIQSDLAKHFADNPKVLRLVEVWDRWHMNDARAGTKAQSALVRQLATVTPNPSYDATTKYLEENGLLVDKELTDETYPQGYSYGDSWLLEPLPDGLVAEIEGWMADPNFFLPVVIEKPKGKPGRKPGTKMPKKVVAAVPEEEEPADKGEPEPAPDPVAEEVAKASDESWDVDGAIDLHLEALSSLRDAEQNLAATYPDPNSVEPVGDEATYRAAVSSHEARIALLKEIIGEVSVIAANLDTRRK